MSAEKVLRVRQLDAAELDEELLSILQKQLSAVFKVFPVTSHLQISPELNAALAAFIWWCTVRHSQQTFGQRMLDLRYSTDPSKSTALKSRHKWIFFFLTICTRWLHERAHVMSSDSGDASVVAHRVERILSYVAMAISSLSLFNFSIFLLRGQCPKLTDRVTGLFHIPAHSQVLKSLSFQLMNREILWHGFSEFLFFILPHINIFFLRNCLRRVFTGHALSSPPDPLICVFCGGLATMAETASCGHVFCYYCLRANISTDTNFPCPHCSLTINNCVGDH